MPKGHIFSLQTKLSLPSQPGMLALSGVFQKSHLLIKQLKLTPLFHLNSLSIKIFSNF